VQCKATRVANNTTTVEQQCCVITLHRQQCGCLQRHHWKGSTSDQHTDFLTTAVLQETGQQTHNQNKTQDQNITVDKLPLVLPTGKAALLQP
jgi:hypothetical protein